MNNENTIRFTFDKHTGNDVTVYLNSEKIDISQIQKCGRAVHLTVLENKAKYYNGSFADYIISLFDRLNKHYVTDIWPPYGAICECHMETGTETVVGIKLNKGYNTNISLDVNGGKVLNEKKCEMISESANLLFNKLFIAYMILLNLPILICAVLCSELWWLPIILFGAVVIPFDIMLIRCKLKSVRIRKNNSYKKNR